MSANLDAMRQKYLALAHAMQSGVAAKMHHEPDDTTPKHLRVGVNSAMVEHSALVQLLIAKGIITEEEYYEALIKAMQDEVTQYETELTQILGRLVKLV